MQEGDAVKITAEVEIKGETTGVTRIENVTTGEGKDYTDGGVSFSITQTGYYTFKAITNTGKSRTTRIFVVTASGKVDIDIEPKTPRNTSSTGTQNGVETGPIKVTITYGEAPNIQYQYKIGKNGSWQTSSNHIVEFEVSENTTIVARYISGVAESESQTYNVKNVDNIVPGVPSVNLNGYSAGNWTNSNITIGLNSTDTANEGIADGIAGILRYEYSKDGGSWAECSSTMTINEDQNSTYRFRAIDKAGNTSEETTSYSIKRDIAEPTISSVTSSNITDSSFTINVTATDSGSGIAKIEYSNNGGETYTTGANQTDTSYTFSGLTAETKYQVRIRVTDSKGNVAYYPNSSTNMEVTTIELMFSDIYTTTTVYTDKNGETATIPKGFGVGISESINNVANGLVITDKIDTNHQSIGNEYVWIPVTSEADFARTEWSGNSPTGSIATNYTEPMNYSGVTGYPGEAEEFNMMKTQVLKYKGFYIGRYEAGDGTNGTTLRTGTTDAHKVVIKKGVAPYNWVPWGTSMTDKSPIAGKSGAVYLAEKVDSDYGYTSVVSTLCYGSQWDAMCRYIGDAGRRATQNYGSPYLTGTVLTDASKNIYDLVGNCFERTMESSINYRTLRGGFYNNRYRLRSQQS